MVRGALFVVVSFLAALSAWAKPPLPPSRDPAYKWIAQGGTAIVFRHRTKPVVAKVIARQALPREDWVTYPRWLADRNGKLSARDRMLIARQTLRAYRVLGRDPVLRDLLPPTRSTAPGRIDQAFMAGLDLDQLSPRARQVAEGEMAVAIRRAQVLLPHEQIDEGVYNFKFDRRGHIRAWFDWVLVAPGKEGRRSPLRGTPRPHGDEGAAGAAARAHAGRPCQIGARVLSFGTDPARLLEIVTRYKLQPRHSLALPGAKFSFTDAFAIGDGRVGVLGVADVNGTRTASLYWRSNSQGLFRLLPALNARTSPTGDAWFDAMPIFDKGFDENALNLPPTAQLLLAELARPAALRTDLPRATVRSLMAAAVPQYRNRAEYEAYEQTDAHPRFHTRTLSITEDARGPRRLRAASRPDFSASPRESRAVDPLGGEVRVLRYPSRDRQLEYTVRIDGQGKAWLSDVTLRDAPLNRFGLPAVVVDAGNALAPRWEYRFQIPARLAGPAHPTHREYASNWNQLRRRPEIRDLYRSLRLPLPPEEKSR